MITVRDLIESKLGSIKDAQSRSRFAFFLTLVVCSAIIAALWNQYFSWEKFNVYNLGKIVDYGKSDSIKLTNNVDYVNVNSVHDVSMSGSHVLVADAIRNWNKSQWITIPLLGIQMSISDVAILGSMTLWILSFWYYLTIRRENTEIGTLLRDCDTEETHSITIKYIYSGIRSNSVFTVLTKLTPINSLKSPLNTSFDDTSNRVVYFLDFLPFTICAIAILSDLYFAFSYNSPYRPFQKPSLIWDLAPSELVILFGMDIFGTFMSILILINCRKIVLLEKATSKILREFFLKYQDQIVGNYLAEHS